MAVVRKKVIFVWSQQRSVLFLSLRYQRAAEESSADKKKVVSISVLLSAKMSII